MRKIVDILRLDLTSKAIAHGAMVELAKPLYMGRPQGKIATLIAFWKAAKEYGDLDLVQKAVDGIKELAEKTGLEGFKGLYSLVNGHTGNANWKNDGA